MPPTLVQLKELAREKGIKNISKLKKKDLEELLGNSAKKLDYATELADVVNFKKFQDDDNTVYKKKWELKKEKLYIAVLINDEENKVIAIKGETSGGKGLGKGGARWNYDIIDL